MRKILIPTLLSLGLMLPTATVNAHKLELVLNQNQTLKNARIALRKGKFKKAIRLYKIALKRDAGEQGNIIANTDLCVAHYLQSDLEIALEYCNTAIKLAPNQWISYNNRGNVLIANGSFDEAEASYKKALKLFPKSEIIQKNLKLALTRKIDVLPDVVSPIISNKKVKNNPYINRVTEVTVR